MLLLLRRGQNINQELSRPEAHSERQDAWCVTPPAHTADIIPSQESVLDRLPDFVSIHDPPGGASSHFQAEGLQRYP